MPSWCGAPLNHWNNFTFTFTYELAGPSWWPGPNWIQTAQSLSDALYVCSLSPCINLVSLSSAHCYRIFKPIWTCPANVWTPWKHTLHRATPVTEKLPLIRGEQSLPCGALLFLIC